MPERVTLPQADSDWRGRDRLARLALVAGFALALIGYADLALLWYPLSFGNPEWEFATISGVFDGLPLGTLGFVLLAAAVILRRTGGRAVVLPIVLWFVAVGLSLLFALYWLSALVAWQVLEAQMQWVLVRAVVKTSLFALVYVSLYGWLGWMLWRSNSTPTRRRV